MTLRKRALALLAAAALCSGCASLDSASAPDATDATIQVARAVYVLDIQASDELRKLLSAHLDLARFQNAPEAEAITPAELDRLVSAAPAQARALLETEGYFDAVVKVQREAPVDGLPQVRLSVEPGPRMAVASWNLRVEGELRNLHDAGDAGARATQEQLRRLWPLPVAAAFRQSAWASAKNDTLARARANGYPLANWSQTRADVDLNARGVAIVAVLDSGPLFRLGALQIEGLQRYDETSVRQLAEFAPGVPYSEKALLDYQERLRKLGLFEAVTVEIDANPASAGAAPVLVRVREQPAQQATVGVGYSDHTGQRVTLEHLHRRVFGRDFFGTSWVAKSKFEFGRDRNTLEGELLSHPLEGGYRNLLAASVERLDTAGTLVNSSRLRAGRTQDTERIERLIFAEALFVTTTDAAGRTSNRALSGNYHWGWRNLDSVVLPTDGQTASAQAALGYALADAADNGAFGRFYARLSAYRPLGRAWYANARIEAGQVAARERVGVPETLLFRAGGDDSVRGYPYRSLGPLKNGVLVSGRTLLTASAELARPVSVNLPAVWWAAFVDAGHAADRWSDVDPVFGYGLGVRWRSPVGPLRADLAYGREVRKYQLHFSVGIAF